MPGYLARRSCLPRWLLLAVGRALRTRWRTWTRDSYPALTTLKEEYQPLKESHFTTTFLIANLVL